MWNLKYNTNESIYENKNRIRDVGKRLVVPKGKEEIKGGSNWPARNFWSHPEKLAAARVGCGAPP